jgi:hypothetical protein
MAEAQKSRIEIEDGFMAMIRNREETWNDKVMRAWFLSEIAVHWKVGRRFLENPRPVRNKLTPDMILLYVRSSHKPLDNWDIDKNWPQAMPLLRQFRYVG